MHAPMTAPPFAWSRAFPGTPEQAAPARRFLAGLLDGPHGRGLRIVASLADAWGRTGDDAAGRSVWFEMNG